MKNLYEIQDKNGNHLCYQVGESEKDAVFSAKNFYGYKKAAQAVFIRED
jgi:hypothetical protein